MALPTIELRSALGRALDPGSERVLSGARGGSHSSRSGSRSAPVLLPGQNQICAYLSIALLIGLFMNMVLGWWWVDPAAALVIAAVALSEGRESWRGEACDCC